MSAPENTIVELTRSQEAAVSRLEETKLFLMRAVFILSVALIVALLFLAFTLVRFRQVEANQTEILRAQRDVQDLQRVNACRAEISSEYFLAWGGFAYGYVNKDDAEAARHLADFPAARNRYEHVNDICKARK